MYSIGDVEELTGIKSHILRYWEEVIPGFAPQKDTGGRRCYTQRELEFIMRLNYLITEKKFTIEGARNQIISETDTVNKHIDIIEKIHCLRKELTDLYLYIKKDR